MTSQEMENTEYNNEAIQPNGVNSDITDEKKKSKQKNEKQDRQRLLAKGNSKKYDGDDESNLEEETEKLPKVSFLELFRYADAWDILLTIVGSLCALVNGGAWPFMLVLLSDTIGSFVEFGRYDNFLDEIPNLLALVGFTRDDARKHVERLLPYCPLLNTVYTGDNAPNCSEIADIDNVFDEMEDTSILYLVGGLIVMTCAFGQVYFFIIASERQVTRIRTAFFRNIERQEMGWFDTSSAGELTVKLTDDIAKIHDAIGDKTSTSIQWLGSSVTGFIICYVYGWELALVMQIASPLLFLAFSLVGLLFTNISALEREAYAKAGGVAEEVISSMRTVQAFGGQEKEALRYARGLTEARDQGVRKSMVGGLGIGLSWFLIFGNWALGIYYGGWLVRHSDYSVRDMMTVFFTALIGCLSLGLAMPCLITINSGRAAAFGVFNIIDRKSKIDSLSVAGTCPAGLKGSVSLRGVHFSYPSRQDIKVLNGMDLVVPAGKRVALVGASGCGKSTVIQLLLRFYDPDEGQVYFDDVDVRGINIKFLRQRVGLVSQEPVLFSATIEENIRYGQEGVSVEEIEEACRRANAYDFVMKLPDQFDTQVGERGAKLSGGQKQRIAIARALVKNPKILLLDEATSALDAENENLVQDALDKASEGRTTIVVAHRLSTVRTADIIMCLDQGVVAESGNHDELMARGGLYANLVSSQLASHHSKEGDGDEDVTANTKKAADLERERNISGKEKYMLESAKEITDASTGEEPYTSSESPGLRLLRMSWPEWHIILLGCLGSVVNGALQPAWALVLSEVIDAYTDEDLGHQSKEMKKMTLYALGVAVLSFVTYFLQEYMFGLAGEILTLRMRDMLFRAVLRQNIGWFDDKRHETGILTSQLAAEASIVQGAMKTTFASSMLCAGNLGTGIVISFIFGWQLALILIGFIPFIVLAGALTSLFLDGAYKGGRVAMDEACKSALACIDNQRTVAALTLEQRLCDQFLNILAKPFRNNLRQSLYACVAFGISQGMYYIAFGVCFYYGSRLVRRDDMDFKDVFKVFGCIIMGSIQLGRAVAFSPDARKAVRAATKIFALHDHRPPIDAYSAAGKSPTQGTFRSTVHLQNVRFRFPTRPDVAVLDDVNVSVEPGQTLALVGESGCGKSTTLQLLERFYDPEAGQVALGRFDIRDLNVQWLRSQIGIVSQEPILFDTSIADNIAYGDNSREVLMDEIIQAAKAANVHNFITALPQGYTTKVGSKGSLLSGGQKQRIAIARALVRNPQILLLDEATSALDTENEKIVQEALDKARAGRTCITIAHRLSTIKDADKIAVFKAGVVHEIGTHVQLMARRGLYYKMHSSSAKVS